MPQQRRSDRPLRRSVATPKLAVGIITIVEVQHRTNPEGKGGGMPLSPRHFINKIPNPHRGPAPRVRSSELSCAFGAKPGFRRSLWTTVALQFFANIDGRRESGTYCNSVGPRCAKGVLGRAPAPAVRFACCSVRDQAETLCITGHRLDIDDVLAMACWLEPHAEQDIRTHLNI